VKNKKKSLDELLEEALVPEEEQPYEIPENWEWVKIGGLTDVVSGGTPKTQIKEYYEDGDIAWISPADLSGYHDKYISYGKKNITELGLIKSSAKLMPKNTVILSTRAPIGYVAIANNELSTNQGFKSFLPNKSYLPEYLYWYLKHSKGYLESMASGTTFKELSGTKAKEISLPLAPIKEQERIVEKIGLLFSKIEEAKQQIEEANETFELRRAAILEEALKGNLTAKKRNKGEFKDDIIRLISAIGENLKVENLEVNKDDNLPDSWRKMKIGQIALINPQKKRGIELDEEEICSFVPMPAVSDISGRIEDIETREYSKVKKGYTYFEEGDILFAKITPCMENGKSAITENLIHQFGFGSTEFHVIRTNNLMNAKYIHYILRSQKFRNEAKAEMTGAVGQQRVPKIFIEDYFIPVPPRDEQDAIVEILDFLSEAEKEVSMLLKLSNDIQILKHSIFSKAFKGELGTNNLSDEPAIELLKSILQDKL